MAAQSAKIIHPNQKLCVLCDILTQWLKIIHRLHFDFSGHRKCPQNFTPVVSQYFGIWVIHLFNVEKFYVNCCFVDEWVCNWKMIKAKWFDLPPLLHNISDKIIYFQGKPFSALCFPLQLLQEQSKQKKMCSKSHFIDDIFFFVNQSVTTFPVRCFIKSPVGVCQSWMWHSKVWT